MSHRTRRHGRKAAAAALLAATALALTACQSGESGATGSDSSASAGSSAGSAGSADGSSKGSADSASQTGTGSAEGSGTNASSGGQQATGSGGASGTGSSAARCTTANMTAGWGSEGGGRPDMNSDRQETAAVWFKNNGSGDCTISGFPGVQLKGTDGTTWDLGRSGKKPVPVTLKPGENTHFTFQLLPSTSDDDRKLEPATVVVTPPNEKQHFELQWPYGGAILDQSGATHPGTFVNPVNVG